MNRPFAKLKASDVMQKDVVTVEASESIKAALSLMTENHVSGLPVVDEDNRCLGLVSASDILMYEHEHLLKLEDESGDVAPYYNVATEEWEDVAVSAFALEHRGDTPVQEIMTEEIIAVSPDTPIPAVAAKMTEHEVHRVLVLEDDQSLHGLISAVDFVRLIAEGIERRS